MDGRIGGSPVNGCHTASGARFDVASPSRDRVTIDLRGIGDAVRAAAACRGMSVAQLVRRALVMSLDLRATAAVAVGLTVRPWTRSRPERPPSSRCDSPKRTPTH